MRRMRDVAERFWSHVDTSGDCWIWTGSLSDLGYARFYITVAARRRISLQAHVWAWEQVNGPVPEGKELDHLCRNRACVRPDHLEAVTHRENILRGTSFMATKAAQTACVNGHPFTEDNIYRRPDHPEWRGCKECNRIRARRNMAKRRLRVSQ